MPATGWGQLPVLDPPPPATGWVPPPAPAPDPPVDDEVPGWGEVPDATPEEPPRIIPGAPGDTGPVGPPGPIGGRLQKLAAGPLSGSRVVAIVEDGEHVDLASAFVAGDAAAIAGLTAQPAAARDDSVEIVRFGEVEDESWVFTPGRRVFVGAGGSLTQTVDRTWAYVCEIGTATATTKLLIDVKPPVFLSRDGPAKFLTLNTTDGEYYEGSAVAASAGAADAGKIPALGADGRLDASLVPPTVAPFVFNQGVPSDTWVITHNLGRFPSVTVVDSAGQTWSIKPIYDSQDQITIRFAFAFSGRAYLN